MDSCFLGAFLRGCLIQIMAKFAQLDISFCSLKARFGGQPIASFFGKSMMTFCLPKGIKSSSSFWCASAILVFVVMDVGYSPQTCPKNSC